MELRHFDYTQTIPAHLAAEVRLLLEAEWPGAAGTAFPMMLFLSAKARAACEAFPRKTLVLPGDEW